jgi:histone H3/H4
VQDPRGSEHSSSQLPLTTTRIDVDICVPGSATAFLVGDQISDIDTQPGQALPKDTIDRMVRDQLSKILGLNLETIQETVTTFFNTINVKIPIISRKRFLDRLAGGVDEAPADFSALCLCIRLVLQHPPQEAQSMQSSLYVIVKNIISLLASTSYYLSLDQIQCRLLVTFYEIGHGISPAASISIGACARMARALGLHKKWRQPISNALGNAVAEEERRVWWAVFNLDR